MLKPDIISELESQRDKELAEWREQRRKQQEEEATKKAATAAEAATKESEGPGSSVDKVEADVVATSSSSATESSQEGATETSTPQNMEVSTGHSAFNSLRPRPNRRHFADDIFKCIFENENEWISPRISLKFVPKLRINNIPALVQIMAWRRPGDKPLSEPMMVI